MGEPEAGPAGSRPAPFGPRLTVLHAMEYRFPEPWHFPPSTIPYSLLRFVTAGAGVFTVDGTDYPVAPSTVTFAPAGSIFECRSRSHDLAFISVRFTSSLSVNGADLLAEAFDIPVLHPRHAAGQLESHFRAIVEASGYPAPARNFLAVGHLSIILGRLVASARHHSAARGTATARIRTSGLRAHDPRIERVMDYLAGNPDAKPDVKALRALTHMSESTLRRSFKDHTGTTIGDYLRNLRMATAARRLLLTDLSVGEIASQLGFPDANYFTRVFKAVFGVAPAHYRRQAREE